MARPIAAYVRNGAGWRGLVRDWKQGTLDLESPRGLFDHLQGEGVLLLNTSLTVGVDVSSGKPPRMRGHFPLWKPLLHGVLSCIASRDDGYAVFLLWGKNAREAVERGGIRAAAERAGTWGAG